MSLEMRVPLLACLIVGAASCVESADLAGSPASKPSIGTSEANAFKELCDHHESLDFGHRTISVLRGHVWVSTDEERIPLQGVQVAARNVSSRRLHYVSTAVDGGFSLSELPSAEYDVWTCMDGFDELRFRAALDPSSSALGLDLYLGPSEAPGRRDVIETH